MFKEAKSESEIQAMSYEERSKYYMKAPSAMNEFEVDVSNAIPDSLDLYDLLRAMEKMYQRLYNILEKIN